MSKLAKLKHASKKSLADFLPSRMASWGTSTLVPTAEQEAPDDGSKPDGITAVDRGFKAEVSETKSSTEAAPPPNVGREIVTYGVGTKKEELPKVEEEPEEILELKTPGFVRVFGCDDCADSDTDFRHGANNSSSEASEDEILRESCLPPHLTPVVHLRVPMRNEDDIRKVVAALQIKGVLEVACDLQNQIVKVSGNADPHRLLKKAKRVKRKSKLISYSNPSAMPQPTLESEIPLPTPPAFVFAEERFMQPPPRPPVFSRGSRVPFSVPPPHAPPRHYDSQAFYHHQRPPPTARPPRRPTFYRDDSEYIPRSRLYPERRYPPLSRSTSPPRRRPYQHFSPPPPRPPPPPPHYPVNPRNYNRSFPRGPRGAYCVDDLHQVPDRMMHMYH